MISRSVPQIPSVSIRTTMAPSQTGGGPTFSRSKEFGLPGVTVKASMNRRSDDRRPDLIDNACPEPSVP